MKEKRPDEFQRLDIVSKRGLSVEIGTSVVISFYLKKSSRSTICEEFARISLSQVILFMSRAKSCSLPELDFTGITF